MSSLTKGGAGLDCCAHSIVAAPYVHPQPIVETRDMGPGTRVCAFAHVMPDARVGDECNVCDHTYMVSPRAS